MSISGNLDGGSVISDAGNPANAQVQHENADHGADIAGQRFRPNGDEAREVPQKRNFFSAAAFKSLGNKATFGMFAKKEVDTIKLVEDLHIASDYTGGLREPHMVKLAQNNLINHVAKAAEQSPTLTKMLVQLRKEGWTIRIPPDAFEDIRNATEFDADTKTIALHPACATGRVDDVLLELAKATTCVVVNSDKTYARAEQNTDLTVMMKVDFELRTIELASELKDAFPACEVLGDRHPEIKRAADQVDNLGLTKHKLKFVTKDVLDRHNASANKTNTTYAQLLAVVQTDSTHLSEPFRRESEQIAELKTSAESDLSKPSQIEAGEFLINLTASERDMFVVDSDDGSGGTMGSDPALLLRS